MKPKHNLSWHKKKTWDACSEYVRRSSADENGICTCYTCGARKPWKQIQAGHGFSGRSNSILFELDIIRTQCFGCNICNSGKLDVFTCKLRMEHGAQRYDQLWKQKYHTRQYSIRELIDLRDSFKKAIKELED